jgi:phosphoesterase RecJ-like protein
MASGYPNPLETAKAEECRPNGGNAPARDPLEAILEVLRGGKRFLVCSHARPDGDAVGSTLALSMLLEQMGKQAVAVVADLVPSSYRRLPGAERIRLIQRVSEPFDAVILLECDGPERAEIEGLEAYFQINIDHHYSGRDYAQLNWIDKDAASVGEMVYRLVKAAGARVTPEMAACLYTTLLTDTGGFRYGSVTAGTFELARELVEAGADAVRIAEEVCFSAPMSKMLLLGAALKNLKREGRVAWLSVSHQDMIRCCAATEDSEGIVNYAAGMEGIEAAVFLRETAEGLVRVSIRSKGRVNVAQLAGRMGGGGHKSAAGCTVPGPLARAIEEILPMVKAALPAGPI